MSIVPLTLTISLGLVFMFVGFFLREQSRKHFGSSESEALLPLAEETPSCVRVTPVDAGKVEGAQSDSFRA